MSTLSEKIKLLARDAIREMLALRIKVINLEAQLTIERERADKAIAALKPFAAIKPSSIYAADGSDVEGYKTVLTHCLSEPEFTGADLACARAVVEAESKS